MDTILLMLITILVSLCISAYLYMSKDIVEVKCPVCKRDNIFFFSDFKQFPKTRKEMLRLLVADIGEVSLTENLQRVNVIVSFECLRCSTNLYQLFYENKRYRKFEDKWFKKQQDILTLKAQVKEYNTEVANTLKKQL